MGVRVVAAGPDGVTLEAPIEPNLNHHATAFGGSVAAVAILAGWTLVHLRLGSEGHAASTVIQTSTVRYLAPIRGAFRAVADPVGSEPWSRFMRAIVKRGKGRVHVGVRVEHDGEVVATLEGAYVTFAQRGSAEGG